MSILSSLPRCYVCSSHEFETKVTFFRPLLNENSFGHVDSYVRNLNLCLACGSYFNSHSLDLSSIYFGEYRESAYINPTDQESRFHKIINLPRHQSDNQIRCGFVATFLDQQSTDRSEISILDVGSGMGVFPYEMSARGYVIDAVDPDPKNCHFLKDLDIARNIYIGNFDKNLDFGKNKYQGVSFNKVLEHVVNFYDMLELAKSLLAEGGIIYIELPDADQAAKDSLCRQEFFLEHYFVPSLDGMRTIMRKAGLEELCLERVTDPSGKYTFRCVCASNSELGD